MGRLIRAALLIAGLVGFLVFVFLEVSLLGMIAAMDFVVLAFPYALLIGLVFRVIPGLVLEHRRGRGRCCGSAQGQGRGNRQHSAEISKVGFHNGHPFSFGLTWTSISGVRRHGIHRPPAAVSAAFVASVG